MPAVVKSRNITPFWGAAARKTPPGKREGTLLERVRAKEAARRAQRQPTAQEKRDEFLMSLLPRISKICQELSMSRTSYVMVEIAEKICTSLRGHLSLSEVVRALVLLAEKQPENYKVVKIGSVTVVKIQVSDHYLKPESAIKIETELENVKLENIKLENIKRENTQPEVPAIKLEHAAGIKVEA